MKIYLQGKMKKYIGIAAVFAVLCLACVLSASPVLAGSSWTPDTSWQDDAARGTAANPYTISSAGELAGLAKLVNEGHDFSGKYFRMINNIDLNDQEWAPIGWYVEEAVGAMSSTNACGFDGMFDGGGHKISGLKIETCANLPHGTDGKLDPEGKISRCAALFGYITEHATVKNLFVEGSVTNKGTEAEGVGGLVGWTNGYIYNVVTSVDVVGSGTARNYCGGIAALNGGGLMQNCVALGPVNVPESGSFGYAGGILGFSSWYRGDIKNCVAMCPSVTSPMDSGGIVGGFNPYVTQDSVSACEAVLVNGSASGSQVGGVVGAYGMGYQNCYWLKVNDNQPAGGWQGRGTYSTVGSSGIGSGVGIITDPAQLPVAAVILNADDLKSIEAGQELEINAIAYPTSADKSNLKYSWTMDSKRLSVISGDKTSKIKVKANEGGVASISVAVTGLLGITSANNAVTPGGLISIVSPLTGDGDNIAEGESRVFKAYFPEGAKVTWKITSVSGNKDISASDITLSNVTDSSVTVTLRVAHNSVCYYGLTASASNGQSAHATISTLAVKGENISGIVPVGDVVPSGTEAVKPVGTTTETLSSLAKEIGASVEDFRVSNKGIVFLSYVNTEKAVKSLATEAGLDASYTIQLPLFSLNTSKTGSTAVTAFTVSGDSLMAEHPEDVKVVKTRPDGTGVLYKYAATPADYTDGHFTIQTSDDVVMAQGSQIVASDSYRLVLYIKDNGDYDICKTDCKIIDPVALVKASAKPDKDTASSSGGGCSAGAGALALLALVPLFRRKKR